MCIYSLKIPIYGTDLNSRLSLQPHLRRVEAWLERQQLITCCIIWTKTDL